MQSKEAYKSQSTKLKSYKKSLDIIKIPASPPIVPDNWPFNPDPKVWTMNGLLAIFKVHLFIFLMVIAERWNPKIVTAGLVDGYNLDKIQK